MNKFWNWVRNSDESRTLYLDGVIAEENVPEELFGNPQNERLKDFLSKML